jgi:FkbM family methyltransferase
MSVPVALRMPGMPSLVLFAARTVWRHAPGLRGKWLLYRLLTQQRDARGALPVYTVHGGVRMRLDAGDWVQRHIVLHGIWEPETTRFVTALLRPGAVVLDVGAHIGYFALLAASRVGRSGAVHAFEPVPTTLARLRENIALNAFDNIATHGVACWSSAGELVIHEANTANTGAASAVAVNAARHGAATISHVVPTLPLDDRVAALRLRRVDLIKIDVEGAEGRVLQGAADTIRIHRPTVILEFDPRLAVRREVDLVDVISTLTTSSYRLRALDRPSGPEAIDAFNVAAVPVERSIDSRIGRPIDIPNLRAVLAR